jgi:alpha-L-fucosidase
MRKLELKSIIVALILMIYTFVSTAQEKKEKDQSMDKMWGQPEVSLDALKAGRGKLFDEGNFAMFIHWGLFSQLGGVWNDTTYYGIGEWIMNPRMAGIPVAEYMKLTSTFNPVDFDANAVAQLAKDAGMKHIIITSKHHEGFAMFKSGHPFNIVDATPFGRDPMKELSMACNEMGLGFGFYYSHNQDWTAPGGSGGPKVNPDGTPATFENYFYSKCKPQVKEICTNYGELDFVWFDTPGRMPKEFVVELAEMVRELQPNAMLCSRIGHGMGDYASKGDMEVPPRNMEGLWETCDTNNDSWAFAWYDNNFKSPKEILHRLVATVGRGGSYLFNVGPDSKGNIPVIGQKFLAGSWSMDKKISTGNLRMRVLPRGDTPCPGVMLRQMAIPCISLYSSGLRAGNCICLVLHQTSKVLCYSVANQRKCHLASKTAGRFLTCLMHQQMLRHQSSK